MRKKERIVRYSSEEIASKIAAGEDKTDWQRVKAMPQEEVERLADEDEGPLSDGWESTIMPGLPPRKRDVHIRLDADILDWFRAQGKAIRRGSMQCFALSSNRASRRTRPRPRESVVRHSSFEDRAGSRHEQFPRPGSS